MFHASLCGGAGCLVQSFKLSDPCTFHVPNGCKVGNENIESVNIDDVVGIYAKNSIWETSNFSYGLKY